MYICTNFIEYQQYHKIPLEDEIKILDNLLKINLNHSNDVLNPIISQVSWKLLTTPHENYKKSLHMLIENNIDINSNIKFK